MSAAPPSDNNTTKILGYDVIFPDGKKPFPAQLAVISRTLAALKGGQNALLESPTGTGKTLALLTSALSYQNADYASRLADYHSQMAAFETQASSTSPQPGTAVPNKGRSPRSPLRSQVPTVDFGSSPESATHSPCKVYPTSPLVVTEGGTAAKNLGDTPASEASSEVTTPPHSHSPRLKAERGAYGLTALEAGRQNALLYKQQLQDAKLNISSASGTAVGAATSPARSTPTKATSSKYVNSPARQFRASIRPVPETASDATAIKKKPVPPCKRRIFYTSRTHSQIEQVIKELRSCPDAYIGDLKMTVLGSRNQLCINKPLEQGVTLDKNCRDLLKTIRGCRFRDKADPLSAKLKTAMVWDIEDAVSNGERMRGCPYYASRTALVDADLVFAPYNYLVDPHIRSSMKIDLTDCVVIFDEAHNIQDTCRSSASCEIAYPQFIGMVQQLRLLHNLSEHIAALYNLVHSLSNWFEQTLRVLLETNGFDNEKNVFDGEEVLHMFSERCGLDANTIDIFESFLPSINEEDVNNFLNGKESESAVANLEFEEETAQKQEELSADVVNVIKKILTTFRFVLAHTNAYKLVLKCDNPNDSGGKFMRRKPSKGATDMDRFYNASFNLWCLSAAVSFQHMAEGTHSILLTSGTLSPLDSFAGELGSAFPIRLETAHVIDQKKQLMVAAIGRCCGQSLQGTYEAQNNLAYQDALGTCVALTSRCSPGGTLVFFSSYSFMDKVLARWESTGQWVDFMYGGQNGGNDGAAAGGASSSTAAQPAPAATATALFREPKTAKELDDVLDRYREIIDEGGKTILFAVCRGKVSEGIDFANNYARSVIVVSIPFPAAKDLHVKLKKQYQNMLCSAARQSSSNGENPSMSSLTGEEWYRQQAYRAINQAVGRCIRHKMDYGAIILCDPRFHKPDVHQNLSKWLRGDVQSYMNFEDTVLSLRCFFAAQDNFHPQKKNVQQIVTTATGTKLTVPLMFSVKKESVQTPLNADKIRSVVEDGRPGAGLGTSGSTSSSSGIKGQLSIGASFTRVSQRVSPMAESQRGCQDQQECGRNCGSRFNDSDGESYDAIEVEEFMESLASTQDICALSPQSQSPEKYIENAMNLDIPPVSPTLSVSQHNPAVPADVFNSLIPDITNGWKWRFVGGSIDSFPRARSLVTDFMWSPAAEGSLENDILLPIKEFTAPDNIEILPPDDFSDKVKQKFFFPLGASNADIDSFRYCNGDAVTHFGVRIEEWLVPTLQPSESLMSSSSSSSSSNAISNSIYGLTYTEEWSAEDGVVYGILRLPSHFGGSALAVSILATAPHRHAWSNAKWAHVEVAAWWCHYVSGSQSPSKRAHSEQEISSSEQDSYSFGHDGESDAALEEGRKDYANGNSIDSSGSSDRGCIQEQSKKKARVDE